MNNLYKALLNPEKAESTIHGIQEYSYSRGGGILWVFSYFIVFVVYINEMIGLLILHDLIKILVAVLLFLIGIFLTISVLKQMKLLETYLKRISNAVEEKEKDLTSAYNSKIAELEEDIRRRGIEHQERVNQIVEKDEKIKDEQRKELNTKESKLHEIRSILYIIDRNKNDKARFDGLINALNRLTEIVTE